ncbi:MAG: hypothetical protein KAR13_05555 [Desulfobulbaceae bacterium]|nr:hypothetical protein [Desulfobulbaceae bacterium]
MNFKSIQTKIGFGTGLCVLVTAVVITTIATLYMRNNAMDAATKETVVRAGGQAAVIESELERTFETARTLANILSGVKYESVRFDLDRDRVMDILRIILINNPHVSGI